MGVVREAVREELKAANSDDSDPLWTAEQVADELGYTDVRSVYKLKREKKLPAVKLGTKGLKFRRSDVRRLIQSHLQE